MAHGARYFGKVCTKHPALNGERRRPGTSDGYRCVECTRVRDKQKRNDNTRARERRREKLPYRKVKAARRRALKRSAVVPLTAAEQQRIVSLYADATRRTVETGIVHHVDHDVPLALGGTHHPDNMNVVPAAVNLAKGAKYASLWDFISA